MPITGAARAQQQRARDHEEEPHQINNFVRQGKVRPISSRGYDADERAFCFAVFAGANELWFQLELDQVSDIATGAVDTYEARPAE
ncbi:MAG: hypothetical protein WKF96_17060 [Solirubrobacteraceae bacterium]